MESAFENRKEAIREARRVARFSNLPYIPYKEANTNV
jgi:hypothetical protein